MKCLGIAVLLLMVLAGGMWSGVAYVERKIEERNRKAEEEQLALLKKKEDEEKAFYSFQYKLIRVKSLGEWEGLMGQELPLLSREEQKVFEPIVRAKIFEGYFRRAERLLFAHRKLLEQDQNHPTAKKYLVEAGEIYKKMEEMVKAIPDEIAKTAPEESDEESYYRARGAHVAYLKGLFFLRSIYFVEKPNEEQEKITGLIKRSAGHFAKVYEFFPNDHDANVAIELLQKTAKDLLSLGTPGSDSRLRLLPVTPIGPAGGFSITGKEKGRH